MYLYLDVTVFQQELLDSFNVLNSAFPFKLTVMWGVGTNPGPEVQDLSMLS